MFIQHNISLKAHNSFGIDVNAKRFTKVTSVEELKDVLANEKDVFVLGGGSNLLLTKDVDKLVIHLLLRGITIEKSEGNNVLIRAQAGENWHDFVLWCLNNDFGGLENLTSIPGNVGSSPIQNIGAYGVEVKDRIIEVETIEITTGNIRKFTNKDCCFAHRTSIFKEALKGQYIIVSVRFKLSTTKHDLNYSYSSIKSALNNTKTPSIRDISNAVIAVRNQRIPNPNVLGNSGSFFENPVISESQFLELQALYNEVPCNVLSKTEIKVPAGWLIEQCGFKGKRIGETGCYKNHALIIVNYGNATGEEVYKLSKDIQQAVKSRFSIDLKAEVNIL